MKTKCSCWQELKEKQSTKSAHWVRHGCYYRRSDAAFIQRFQCSRCLKTVSQATFHVCYRQKKRRYNLLVERALCSGVTQRRAALILGLNRKTVVRKFLFMASLRQKEHQAFLQFIKEEKEIYFDEMETHEITKWKPLSIALAVNKKREILSVQVSRMPARGLEAPQARAKYGPRRDERKNGIVELLKVLKPLADPEAEILTDEKPLYRSLIAQHLPGRKHKAFKGKRGCIAGQGELKKTGKDPLFPLNHTAAMLRANLNRLIRRTWSVTQKPERLLAHLYLYIGFHNQILLNN